MFAGKTLAEIAAVLAQDSSPDTVAHAVGTLTERITRPNASPGAVKRATAALDRLLAGTSVAIPARPEKAPKAANAPVRNPNLAGNVERAAARVSSPRVTREDAFRLVRAELQAAGHPVPRAISAGCRGKALSVRTNA